MVEAGGQGGRLPTQILAEEKVQWRCAELLLLVYTRQLEFLSVYSMVKSLVLGFIS